MTGLAPPAVEAGRAPSPLSPWKLYRRLPRSVRKRLERVKFLARLKGSTVAVRDSLVLRIVEALETRGIPVWLSGGWGVDALVGRPTRQHHDLDLVVRAADTDGAVACLGSLGFRFYKSREVPAARLSRGLVFRDALGRHVDLHPVVLEDPAGAPASCNPRLPPGCLGTGTLRGRPVRCLTAATQIDLHRGYEPRARDLEDLALLRKVRESARS
jgi:lincosamide nucleotidyltransferase A/C/D/E